MQSSKHASVSEEDLSGDGTEKLDMTLGVEIECLLVQDLQLEPFPDDHSISHVRHGLCLTDEQTQSLPSPDDSIYTHAIEVVSRTMQRGRGLSTTLDDRDSSHMHEISYDEEITAVITALNAHFNMSHAQRSNAYRLVVNEQCGLHVHIGNGRKSFPLHTIKNVVAMHTANEKQIDGLHAVSRVDGRTLISGKLLSVSPSWKHSYNKPWSAHFVDLEHAVRNGKAKIYGSSFPPAGQQYPNVLFDERPELRKAVLSNDLPPPTRKSIPAQLDNLASYEPHSYDQNTSDHLRGKKLTIESRQHVGTLEPDEILSWTDVLLHLLQFAHDHPKEQVRTLCLKISHCLWPQREHSHLQALPISHWCIELGRAISSAERQPRRDRSASQNLALLYSGDREPGNEFERSFWQFVKGYLEVLEGSGLQVSEMQKGRLILGNRILGTVEKVEGVVLGGIDDFEFEESELEGLEIVSVEWEGIEGAKR
ncbi:hypothetical protein AC578_9062 [Pseudocercospora eumusae]|uniref:Amidoligase enzyme n=1 Tax=Pseudocercospora eumusae TaxID=321146 RepID=A0A139H8J1_9PEZI|nr:hypothetical protein AC578_9062 [Pseudocercospora eumusae]